MTDIHHIGDLKPDAHNARRHNARNVGMIEAALHEVGAARSIVIDEDGRVLAGNGVLEAAAAAGIERVKVVPADGNTIIAVQRRGLTEAQKTKLALYDNRTGDLSEFDAGVLASIQLEDEHALDGLFTNDELESLFDGLQVEDETTADAEAAPLTRYDVPDALFATDNDWGVPLLDAKVQPIALDVPCRAWGKVPRKSRFNGTYHFYTDDYKFEALWDDPSPVVNSGCVAAVEPNFTTTKEMPRAFGLFQIYRKRWLARFWQTFGIKVFVDMNVSAMFYDLNRLGVPAGWKAFCTRGYTAQLDAIEAEHAIAAEIAGGDPVFVVYGGGKAVWEHCKAKGYIWVAEDNPSGERFKDG
jgi:hypothetical protein